MTNVKRKAADCPDLYSKQNIKIMNTALWIIQAFLAAVFLYSGIMKTSQQREKLVSIGQTGVADLSYPVIRLIGISEILGAAGIIAPLATGIWPFLTSLTAVCFAAIMVMAAAIHYKRAEFKSVAFNITVLLLSVLVAYMRFREL